MTLLIPDPYTLPTAHHERLLLTRKLHSSTPCIRAPASPLISNQPRWWWLLLKDLDLHQPTNPLVAGGQIPLRTRTTILIIGLEALLQEPDTPGRSSIVDIQENLKGILAQINAGQPNTNNYFELFDTPAMLLWQQSVMNSIHWLWLWKG